MAEIEQSAESAVSVTGQALGRRPLRSRQSPIAHRLAEWLAARGVTPNQISLASIALSALAAASLCLTRFSITRWQVSVEFLLTIVGIQGRLACNLLDGLVAVEGRKAGKCGEIYNDAPDRLADALILVAAGYAAGGTVGPTLGWLAAVLSVMTAYVRVLGRSIGSGVYFIGPMAKQQRMATLTVACVLAAVASIWHRSRFCMLLALIVICLGCVPTIIRRLSRIAADLEAK